MKTQLIFSLKLLCIASCLIFVSACKKNIFEPSIDGTWIEIDSISSQNPTGCELVINQSAGDVSLCGFDFVQPKNVVAAFVKKDAKLFIKDGQMFYRQKKSGLLWLVSVAKEDLYFIDYDFEGDFLWIIGNNSSSKATAKGVGKLFKKK